MLIPVTITTSNIATYLRSSSSNEVSMLNVSPELAANRCGYSCEEESTSIRGQPTRDGDYLGGTNKHVTHSIDLRIEVEGGIAPLKRLLSM